MRKRERERNEMRGEEGGEREAIKIQVTTSSFIRMYAH